MTIYSDFMLSIGRVAIQIDDEMTQDEFNDMCEWLELIKRVTARKIARKAAADAERQRQVRVFEYIATDALLAGFGKAFVEKEGI